jgi:hypothetical protein
MSTHAQEVWKEVRRLSKQVADNTDKDIQTRKIATFKIDALDYMKQRYYEQMQDSSITVFNYKLDHQAYALYDFINQFIDQIAKAEKKKDKYDTQYMTSWGSTKIQVSQWEQYDKEVSIYFYYNAKK